MTIEAVTTYMVIYLDFLLYIFRVYNMELNIQQQNHNSRKTSWRIDLKQLYHVSIKWWIIVLWLLHCNEINNSKGMWEMCLSWQMIASAEFRCWFDHLLLRTSSMFCYVGVELRNLDTLMSICYAVMLVPYCDVRYDFRIKNVRCVSTTVVCKRLLG